MNKSDLQTERRALLISLATLGLIMALIVLPSQFRSTASINVQESAQIEDQENLFPNYDIRTDKSAVTTLADFRARAGFSEVAANSQRMRSLAAETNLRKRLPALRVEYSAELHVPEVISTVVTDDTNSLQRSKSGNRPGVLESFLKANNELVILTDGQVDELKVAADYTNPAGNLSFVRLEQTINGIPVFNGEVNAGYDKNGNLFRVLNHLAPGLEYSSLSQDFGEPVAAVQNAFKHVERGITPDDTQLNVAASNAHKAVFGKEDEELPTLAEKMYFPLAPGVARAAWRVFIPEAVMGYYVIVDAETGVMLWRQNLVNHQTHRGTYNVYVANNMVRTADNPAPFTPGPTAPDGSQAPAIPRTNVTLVGNEPGYEFNSLGWILDGTDTTEGNNTRAGLDRVTPDGIDAVVVGQVTTTGGVTTRVFNFNYLPAPNPAPSPAPTPPNLPLTEPLNDSYQRGAVTHLFYLTNRYHDEMYRLGFTEEARNFQQNNFGRGGLGNDRVLAQAQDFSGVNNANFLTPADGTSGRMQMYLWPNPDPDRDGDLDSEIVIHELTHGTSTRLHNQALNTNHAGGMGEGWGDFYAHAMLSEPTDPIEGIYTTGGYSTHRGNAAANYVDNYYYGIRRFPKAVLSFRGPNGKPHNPLSFRHLNANCNTEIGVGINPISAYPRNPVFGSTTCDQVHAAGEIWSSALWEVRAKYIQRLGHTEGTRRVLQHVTDGMKLAPRPPTFLSERDAIIAAAQAGGEQADVDDIWAGFALRGMGFSARIISISPANVVEAFDVPLIINPSFEQGLAPWENWGNSEIVANPSAPNGSNELRIGTGAGGVYQNISTQPNTIYTLSAWGRVSTAGETGWIGVHYLDSGGNQIAPQSLTSFNNTTYEQKQLSVQVPPNTVTLRVWAWKNSGEGYFFVDNITLTGSFTVNPSFEQGLAPWENWGNSEIVANPSAPNGSNELRIGTGAGGVYQNISTQPNTIYTLSAWGRVSTAGETGWIGVHYLDSGGNQIAPQSLTSFNNTTYEQKQLSVQVPPNTVTLRVWAWKNSGEGYFFVDNITLTRP
jgi:hypothetical protein